MEAVEWNIPDAPVKGFLWAAENPRAAILLTHGLSEHSHSYVNRHSNLIPTLVSEGYNVYAYDQRGHGRSEGKRSVVNAKDLLADHFRAREALANQGLPLFLYGHSMGGLITVSSATKDPRGVSGVILSSPALLVGENEPAALKAVAPILGKIAPSFRIADLPSDGVSSIPEEVELYRQDPLNYIGKIAVLTASSILGLSASMWPMYPGWQIPVLIVQGSEDKLVDPRGSKRFYDAIPAADKTLEVYEGGYHELLNDKPRKEVLALILSWLGGRTP